MRHPKRGGFRSGGGGRCRGVSGGGGGGRGLGVSGGGGGGRRDIVPHKHNGVFVAVGGRSGDVLFTKNLLYVGSDLDNEDGTEPEYREWSPSQSKLAAAINEGVQNIWINPGAKVLCLGAGSDSISHISDIVGPNGKLYVVETDPAIVANLQTMEKERTNITVFVESLHTSVFIEPLLVSAHRMVSNEYLADIPEDVDVIYSEAHPTPEFHASIVGLNAHHLLKFRGRFVVFFEAIYDLSERTKIRIPPLVVFDFQVKKLERFGLQAGEQISLPVHRHGDERRYVLCVAGSYMFPEVCPFCPPPLLPLRFKTLQNLNKW